MSKSVLAYRKKANAYDRIQRFYFDGDIVLTAEEENILMRWKYAHSQIITRKYSEDQVVANICQLHNVSEYTARDDYYKAMTLYSGLIKVNKKFLLHHHAQNILLKIEKYSTDKTLVHLVPKLMEAYTKTVIAIPDDDIKQRKDTPVIKFNIVSGQKITDLSSIDDAIKRLNQSTEIIDIDSIQIPEQYDEQ